MDYIVNDQMFHMQPGDLLIIPPNILHNPVFLDFEVPYERYVVWISSNTLGRLIRQDPDCGYFLRKDVPRMYLLRSDEAARDILRGNFVTLLESYRSRTLCFRSEGLAVIMHILTEYNRALAAKNGKAQRGSSNTLLSSVLRYVQHNLTGDLSLDAVAAKFFSNKNSILAGVPVNKVWETCGFSDHAGFYRAFRKWYGISPSQFRKMHAERIQLSE